MHPLTTTAFTAAAAGFFFGGALPVTATAQTLKTLYSFAASQKPNDGAYAYGPLIYSHGALYGTTSLGGNGGNGTIFTLDPNTGAEAILYNFTGAADGKYPEHGVLALNGNLYGTALAGGAGDGAVFAVNATTGAGAGVYDFPGQGNNGTAPECNLIARDGGLYGTTNTGGAANAGTVFTLDPATGAERVLYSFKGGADGKAPQAGLVYLKGHLYGTTSIGGALNFGAVFDVDVRSGIKKNIYSFTGANGDSNPTTGLIYEFGMFYGTTTGKTIIDKNAVGNGSVFEIDAATHAYTNLHSFSGQPDGAFPAASLVYVNGSLYGTTTEGGTAGNWGTVFKVDATTGATTILYTFTGGADGGDPFGALLHLHNKFYGTTAAFKGSVFELTP